MKYILYRQNRQCLISTYHTSYDLLWFLQYLFCLWLKGKFYLVYWLSRSSIWLLAELLLDTLFQQRRKNIFLKKLFCSSVSWAFKEYFRASFKEVFGLIIRTLPSSLQKHSVTRHTFLGIDIELKIVLLCGDVWVLFFFKFKNLYIYIILIYVM